MNSAVTSAPETHLIILSQAKHTLTSLHHHIATAAALQTQFPPLCITGSSERSYTERIHSHDVEPELMSL